MLEEEAAGSPTTESMTLSDETETHLQEMARLLGSKIVELLLDAKSVRAHYEALHDQVPESIEEALIPITYIEATDSMS